MRFESFIFRLLTTPAFLVRLAMLSAGGILLVSDDAEGGESRDHVWDLTFPLEAGAGTYRQGWHDCRPSAANCTRAHRAVDIYAEPGTPVHAAADGTIAWRRTSSGSGWSPTSGSGYALYIDDPSGDFRHFYGHFGPDVPNREEQAFGVNPGTGEIWKAGDKVTRGQHLGWVGTSGATASGPHVHFELRSLREGLPVDDPGNDAKDGRDYGDPDAAMGLFAYLRYDPYPSLVAAENRGDYPSGASTPRALHAFAVGDYVEVTGVNTALNVRGPDPCDDPIDDRARPRGSVGRITAGPERCEFTRHNMWRIRWSQDCFVGWASEWGLQATEAPEEDPCPDEAAGVNIDNGYSAIHAALTLSSPRLGDESSAPARPR